MGEFAQSIRAWLRSAAAPLIAGLVVVAALAPLGAGCAVPGMPAPAAPRPAAQSLPTRSPLPPPPASPTPAPASELELPPGAQGGITLTMWSTEVFSPLQNDLGSRVLKQQVDEFHAAMSDVGVRFVLKKAYGKGGMAHALVAAGGVAPGVLPDLAIVDLTELPAIATAGLARPMEDLIAPSIQADLYPFAAQAGQVDGQMAGLPFEVEVSHLAYSRIGLGAPPLRWTDVLSSGVSYVFAAGNDPNQTGASEIVWLHYLAANRGPLKPDIDGALALQPAALREMLSFYAAGLERGVIPRAVLDYRTEADAWPAYLSGRAGMIAISSLRYLSSRGLLADTAYGACTGPDGRPFTVATGWAYVIVTRDPARQAACARLIDWLMEPGRNAAWTRAANRLPPTRRAMSVWGPTDSYAAFARTLLENAAPLPSGPEADALGRSLQRAVRDVLQGAASPADAAAAALSGG